MKPLFTSFFFRVVVTAALLPALAVLPSPINFTTIAQQEGQKKRAGDHVPENRSSDQELTVRIETRLIDLTVKAVDAAGRPVTDLKNDDFEVFEDGVKQQITHFSAVTAPVNVVLLIDLGGATKKRRQVARDAAAGFIDALPPQDKIALGAFTRDVKGMTEFSSDRATLKTLVKGLNSQEGGRAYYDAMLMAYEKIASNRDRRKVMVVISDGADDSLGRDRGAFSESSLNGGTHGEVLRRAYDNDVTVYPIYLDTSRSGGSFDRFFSGFFPNKSNVRALAYKQFESLANETGGEIFAVSREEELVGAYQRVASELHNLYSLAYSPDKPKHDSEFRKVSVKVGRAGVTAKTRRGYYDK